MRHDFDDGKYTVIFDEKTGKMEALRHGEPWQDLCGNNLAYFMLTAYDSTLSEVSQLQARVAELEAAIFDLHFTACNDGAHDINSKTASALLTLYHKVRRQ